MGRWKNGEEILSNYACIGGISQSVEPSGPVECSRA